MPESRRAWTEDDIARRQVTMRMRRGAVSWQKQSGVSIHPLRQKPLESLKHF